MRTSSPLHSRRSSARRWILFLACGVVALLALLNRQLGAGASYVMAPLAPLVSAVTRSHDPLSSFFRSHASLAREIETLQGALRTASYDKARLAELEEESLRMRGVGTNDRIVADVVRAPNDTPYDTLLLNKGTNDGVREGALAYSGKTAIGTVLRAYPRSAFVVLFSTPDVVSPVYVYGARVFARAVGQGGGVIRVSVPQGISLTTGDPVVAVVGDTDLYGTIEYVESDPSNPDQYGYVTQKDTLASLRTVLLAREPAPVITPEEARRLVARVRMATTSEGLSELLPLLATTTATTSP